METFHLVKIKLELFISAYFWHYCLMEKVLTFVVFFFCDSFPLIFLLWRQGRVEMWPLSVLEQMVQIYHNSNEQVFLSLLCFLHYYTFSISQSNTISLSSSLGCSGFFSLWEKYAQRSFRFAHDQVPLHTSTIKPSTWQTRSMGSTNCPKRPDHDQWNNPVFSCQL